MARFIHENERMAVMRDEKRREPYVSYIGALYQESTMWDTGIKTWALVESLMLDIVWDNVCQSYVDGAFTHCDDDDLCAKCKELKCHLEETVETARAVHEDLLKERGLHFNPFGCHVHLSNAYSAHTLGAFIANNSEFIEEAHQLAMKDFSLQPEDM